MFLRWKVSTPYIQVLHFLIDLLMTSPEWTFAKQKWQRTPNKVRGDPELENAQILPGFKEKYYA